MFDSTHDTNGSVFSGIKEDMISAIDKGFSALEGEQSKMNKAFFECLSMEQRDKFCQSLSEQGMKSARIEKLTGKSQATINRHMNGKNS